MSSPSTQSLRLRQALLDRGITKPDGSVNAYRFAQLLHEADGNVRFDSWERRVYAWLQRENPKGISPSNQKFICGVLDLPDDYFNEEALVAELQRTDERLDDFDDRLARLESLVTEIRERLSED